MEMKDLLARMPDAPGIVGEPIDRIDGRLKVTGGARYAYEMQQENVLYWLCG